ncbi:hypothetical protein LZ30DRAFT_700987 [Colletotrichum cereale]|nr:hypothetical protein LZ30DRAFT_700987 [Colletotrichum cereale]
MSKNRIAARYQTCLTSHCCSLEWCELSGQSSLAVPVSYCRRNHLLSNSNLVASPVK